MILISYSVHMLLGLYIIHVSINVGKSPKQYSGSEIIWMDDILGLEAKRFIYFLGDSYTPALSHDQDSKKGRNKRSIYSEPFRPTDTGKYCQNLKTWGKTDFLPQKWVKKT